MLVSYGEWLKTSDGRAVYEAVQIQRAFSLMHLQRLLSGRRADFTAEQES